MPDPRESPVESLMERCIIALDKGDQPGCDALLAGQPEAIVATVRAQLERLAGLGMLQQPRIAETPKEFGEFRLVRQLGRGGMGVVYVAEQATLQRQVALKLVVPEHLYFSDARERFRREVLAIARLQHPGIVPVLTCGEVDGVPFYAMELVAGASLAELIVQLAGKTVRELDGTAMRRALAAAIALKGFPVAIADGPLFAGSWAQACARIVLAAAEALRHAHARGVLHRDVKPSNLLLDGEGHVQVIDFGLASARGEQRITRSGATFGSLPYMAPEQVRGDNDAIDARTDVYALGVTLYELLTLSLPHGDGSGTTRERILAGHCQAPATHNHAVPADLDAVCLCAMDPQRERRYADMGAFADDLRAFLEMRSVRARRPSVALRLLRWAARHPARAAVAAVAFLTLVPGPAVFAIQQSLAAKAVQKALDLAEAQGRRSDQALAQALAAVDQMLLRTATGPLSRHPRTVKLRRSLLEDALAFYDRLASLAAEGADQERIRIDAARAAIRVGELHAELGDPVRAGERLTLAIAALDHNPRVAAMPAVQLELATALRRLGESRGTLDRVAEAVPAVMRSRDLFLALIAAEPGNTAAAEGLLSSRMLLANLLARSGRLDDAHAEVDAIEREAAAPAGEPADDAASVQAWLARAHAADQRAFLHLTHGESELAQRCFEQALQLVEALPEAVRRHDDTRVLRLGILERLGNVGLQRREWDKAAGWLDLAAEELDKRVAEEPEPIEWRARLADVLGSRATNRRELRQAEGSMADHDRAIALLEQVVRDAPKERQQRRRLAIAFAERAGGHAKLGEFETADADLERATKQYEDLLATDPQDALVAMNLPAVLANRARVKRQLGDSATARQLIERAIAIALQRSFGENERSLVELYGFAADLAMQDLDTEAGAGYMREASDRATAWLAKRPEDPLRLATAAMIGVNRGTMHLQMQDHAQAAAVWEQTLPIARKAATSPFGQRTLATLLLRLADVAERDGDMARARTWFQRAIEEGKADARQYAGMPPLDKLFVHPGLKDLVPAAAEKGR